MREGKKNGQRDKKRKERMGGGGGGAPELSNCSWLRNP